MATYAAMPVAAVPYAATGYPPVFPIIVNAFQAAPLATMPFAGRPITYGGPIAPTFNVVAAPQTIAVNFALAGGPIG